MSDPSGIGTDDAVALDERRSRRGTLPIAIVLVVALANVFFFQHRQAKHIVANNGLAGVAYAHEVAAITG